MSKETNDYRFTLRLPADLYELVKRVAEREERSVHGQVVWCVKQCTQIQAEAQRQAGDHGWPGDDRRAV